MGKTLTQLKNELETEQGGQKKIDGAQRENVYGSYVHGIFDAPDVAKQIVTILMREKGIATDNVQAFQMKEYKEQQYDLLADTIRQALDMEKVYEIIEKGM